MASVATLTKLAQAEDPKKALIKEVGSLANMSLMGNRVLVAIYIAPEKMVSGLYRPSSQLKEDVYQGTVGLVLKLGPQAFRDEPETKTFFHGTSVPVGSWVVFRPGDAKRIQINGVDCRMVEDTLIDMVIDNPELVTHK